MEEEKDISRNKNKFFLIIIGISILLVALVGATFAYFTLKLTDNSITDNLYISTKNYGLTVVYEDDKDSIKLENKNLIEAETGDKELTNYLQDEVNFKVTSTSSFAQKINIGFAEGFSNTFCQTVESQEDTVCGNGSTINVAGEIYYELYICDFDYSTNCRVVSTGPLPLPIDETTPTVLKSGITIPSTGDKTVYIVLKAFIRNKEVQSYNKGKIFSGKIWVSKDIASE